MGWRRESIKDLCEVHTGRKHAKRSGDWYHCIGRNSQDIPGVSSLPKGMKEVV